MPRRLIIDGCEITDDSDTYVVAEIGHNHQGDLEKAVTLFQRAKECGVNAVKLQKRDNRTLYTRAMYDSPYSHENSFGSTYGAHREALELGKGAYVALKQVASELKLTMFATAFDFPSVDFLAELDMPVYKIASGDLTNTPLLRYVARIGKPIIVSTGGATMADVQRAYDTIAPLNSQLCLLQCTASYPVDPAAMNLRVITTYRDTFLETTVGLSDHQNGIALAVVAQALGARVIEKHFTLDRAAKGTDHAFSLEPAGMRKMVRDLRRARLALGDAAKRRYEAEEKPLNKMGKKLVAARPLRLGHVLRPEDIAIKSPNDGLPPYELENVIGKVLTRNLQQDDNIAFADLRQT